MVSYPGELPEGSRRARPRRQKMFSSEEAARVFMRGRQREYILSKRLSVGWDGEEHLDALRAKAVLLDMPGASLESAAWLLKLCRSAKEMRGGGFEVATNRNLELEPRTFLGLENVARKLGCRVKDVAEGAIWDYLHRESWKLRAVEEISPERECELEAERERESKKLLGINRALKRILR
jgi:hypothetical protein